MTTKIKIYLAIGSATLIFAAGYSLWSNYQITKLESTAEKIKQNAESRQQRAIELEASAKKYEEKIAFLKANLAELRTVARKQDEELKNIKANTNVARRDVERARRVRSAAATADEVCGKLAELGHPCR